MTKYFNKIICTVVAVMIASPAWAAITELGKNFEKGLFNFMYFGSSTLGGGIDDGGFTSPKVYRCGDNGTYTIQPKGMECDLRDYAGGTKCYTNCRCSVDKFPYTSSCSGPNFIAPVAESDKCTDATGTYYASCACGSGLVSDRELNNYSTAMNYMILNEPFAASNRKNPESPVLCYNTKTATCGSGSVEIPNTDILSVRDINAGHVRIRPKSEPVWYNAATFGRSSMEIENGVYKVCSFTTSGVESFASFSVPANTVCASYQSANIKYDNDPTNKFYYYTGDCRDSGLCTTETSDCVKYTSETFIAFNPETGNTGNGSCKYITGCKTGWDSAKGHFCSWSGLGDSVVPSSVNAVEKEIDSQKCIKVAGCKTADGYEQVAFKESDDALEVENIASNAVRKAGSFIPYAVTRFTSPQDEESNTYGMVVCRKPSQTSQCKVGMTYDLVSGLCVDGTAGDVGHPLSDFESEHYIVLETKGATARVTPGMTASGGVAKVMDWDGSITYATDPDIARSAAHDACQNRYGGTLLSSAEVDYLVYVRGYSMPFEGLDHVGEVITSDGCYSLISGRKVTCGTQSSWAYACGFDAAVNDGINVAESLKSKTCAKGAYYLLGSNACMRKASDGGPSSNEEVSLILETNADGMLGVGVFYNAATGVARVQDWANGGGSVVVTEVNEARSAAHQNCQDRVGGTILTADEMKYMIVDKGHTLPIEMSGTNSGMLVGSDKCFDMNTMSVKECPATSADYAYLCKFYQF